MKIGTNRLRRGVTLTVALAATALLATALPASANGDKGSDGKGKTVEKPADQGKPAQPAKPSAPATTPAKPEAKPAAKPEAKDKDAKAEKCVPAKAWVQVIPAQGKPWTKVKVAAIPPQAEVFHLVDHDAVTTEYYQRWSWTPAGAVAEGDTPDVTGSTPATDPAHWKANQTSDKWPAPGNGNLVIELGVAYTTANPNSGNSGSWFIWTTEEKTVKDAWTEKVVDQEAVAGVPASVKKVANPDYVAKQVIKHDAVVCDKDKKSDKKDGKRDKKANKSDKKDKKADKKDKKADKKSDKKDKKADKSDKKGKKDGKADKGKKHEPKKAAAAEPKKAEKSLAATGAQASLIALIALALAGVGTAAVIARRRFASR